MWVRRRRLLMVLTILPMVSLLWLAGLETSREPAEVPSGSSDSAAAVDGALLGRPDHLVAVTFAAVDTDVQRREAVVKDEPHVAATALVPSTDPSTAASTAAAPALSTVLSSATAGALSTVLSATDEDAEDARADAEAAARELAAWAAVLAADRSSGGAGLSALSELPWQAFLPAETTPLPALEELVTVYMIALGDVPCTSSHLEIALWSLYAKGEWKGRTVVVTDAPACIRLDRVIAALGPGTTAFPGPVDMHVIAAPAETPKSAIQYKLWKLRALEVAAAPGTPYVLYLDVDAFVRTPLGNFLRAGMLAIHQSMQLPANAAASPPASALAAFCAPIGASPATYHAYGLGLQRERCHSGVMLLHRDVSPGCLARWQQYLVDGHYERDQLALDHVLNNSTGCRAAALVPREWITYPNTTTLDAYDLDVARHTTFLHITRTYRMRELRRLRVHISRALDVPLIVAEDKPVIDPAAAAAPTGVPQTAGLPVTAAANVNEATPAPTEMTQTAGLPVTAAANENEANPAPTAAAAAGT